MGGVNKSTRAMFCYVFPEVMVDAALNQLSAQLSLMPSLRPSIPPEKLLEA